MTRLTVCDFLQSTHLLAPEMADRLRAEITTHMAEGQITLDFINYDYISSSFLNSLLGKLIIEQQWSLEDLLEHIQWENVVEDDEPDFLIAIDNALTKRRLIDNDVDPDEFYNDSMTGI